MLKKNSFNRKFPLLSKYITDEYTRTSMLDNKDLVRKYEACEESIRAFLHELDKYFDLDTEKQIISSTILKFPDEILLSFICAYLNSEELTKKNADVVAIYNEILLLGEECIKFTEIKGISSSQVSDNLPDIVVDEKFKRLCTVNDTFNGEKLLDCYESLNYDERKYVINLLENRSFFLFNILFSDLQVHLNTLLTLLVECGVDSSLIDERLIKKIGIDELKVLILTLIVSINTPQLTEIINSMLDLQRYTLLKEIIENDIIDKMININIMDLPNIEDDIIIEILKNETLNLVIKDEN